MNRKTAYIRTEPQSKTPNGGLIREAIIWGNPKISLTKEALLQKWQAKKRKTPAAVMLTKAIMESGTRPYISRYEVGHIKTNPQWKWKDEFSSTSYGLFQLMGFHLTGRYKPASTDNVYGTYTIDKQLDHFDEFFSKHLERAKKLFPNSTPAAVLWHAFAGYIGNYNPAANSSVSHLANLNFNTYKKLVDTGIKAGELASQNKGLIAIAGGALGLYLGFKYIQRKGASND